MTYKTLNEAQVAVEQELEKQINQGLGTSSWTIEEKLAIAFRLLSKQGHGNTLAGQITVRNPNGDGTFLTNNFGAGFHGSTPDQLIRINSDMEVVEGEGMPNPGVRFHLWIYRAKPLVNSIVHTHPPYASALSMLEQELIASQMDTCMFYEDCSFLKEWPGVPLANEEGKIIAEALGDNKSVLLAHHGMLTTGDRIEEAAYLAWNFENAARLQLLSQAAGEIKPVKPEHGRKAHDFLLNKKVVDATFDYWGKNVLKESPDFLSKT